MGVPEELPDLPSVPEDIEVPAVTPGPPGPGKRVRLTATGWEKGEVHHTLYLPKEWKSGGRYPVIVEYAGNGGYENAFGDVCEGTVEGCHMGYGLSGGEKCLWICLPYVAKAGDEYFNAPKWWGDVTETKRYALAVLRALEASHGADLSRVILAGFSRGSIGCNYLGLHDDEIAPVWRAFFCHSHYDGVRDKWPYAGADRASAMARLQRLRGRPQWISHEGTTAAMETYLRETGIKGDFTFQAIPFRNHSDRWLLRDIPARKAARAWLERVLGNP